MRILHTADWHLGKRLDNYSRHQEQILVLEEIITIAEQQKVDVVLLAGDLYDSINPPMESQALFYKTLKRLAKDGARPVIAIAGNHDSPDRIDSPDPLAKECGILFIGKPKADIGTLTIDSKMEIAKSAPGFIELCLPHHPPLRILHTAYANEQRWNAYFGTDKAKALSETLQEHWADLAQTYCKEDGINVLLTHLFMQAKGGAELEEPEGEKPLKVGNASIIFSDIIPNEIQYTALGHLHRYHNIGTIEKPIVYSSAPIAYSFSEANQEKYVIIIDAVPNEAVTYTKIAITQGKKLYRKTFHSINESIEWLKLHPNTLVELTIKSDTFLTPQETKLLHEAHDGIVYIIPVVAHKGDQESTAHQSIDLTKDVAGLFIDYFKHKNNGVAPNEDLLHLLNEIIAEA